MRCLSKMYADYASKLIEGVIGLPDFNDFKRDPKDAVRRVAKAQFQTVLNDRNADQNRPVVICQGVHHTPKLIVKIEEAKGGIAEKMSLLAFDITNSRAQCRPNPNAGILTDLAGQIIPIDIGRAFE